MLYEHLLNTYGENEPIFISSIRYGNSSTNYIRQQIKKLVDEGRLKRYDTGIYYIPRKSIFKSGSTLSRDKVIDHKYLTEAGHQCGYISGVMFANQLGLTTQIPMICEIVTNKATNEYRKIRLASSSIIVKKPRTPITDTNYRQLQLLDLLLYIDFFAETALADQHKCLLHYMQIAEIRFSDLEAYLQYYPERIYKNMYEVNLLHGISA